MPEISPSKYLVQAGWQDIPHLDEKTKAELMAATPPHLRDARTAGIPSLGAGAIYPIPPSEILVDPFPIPPYFPRVYGMDVGWNRTAAVWGAWDRAIDCIYLYTEHYRGQAEPSIHASAIRARGEWIPGVIDPAARGRQQGDGEQLLAQYRNLGLKLTEADNALEAGMYAVWERLSTGRLKVFRTLQNWQAEYRLYRRDENGKVVKEFDHLMDATRYLVLSGLSCAKIRPAETQMAVGSAGAGDPTAGY
ncbi:terminase [Fodinicurvata sediminis]|uniref:phage terminase large subunit family protein n=1 Tax=Fodinicurvata sediminis TaxID=1121832 RepID=UPI0003B64E6D|nr:terminase [Fodinicurvata sediminis]